MSEHTTPTAKTHESARLLATYLRDHRAAADAGLALLRQCQQSNEGSALGSVLAELHGEVDEDRRSLEQIMERLDVAPSRVKMLVGKATPLLGRLKHNNRPFGPYSPLTRVFELETLAAGILTKQHLWLALLAITGTDSRLDQVDLQRLSGRATAQLERGTELHRPAARQAFTAPGGGNA